MARVWPGSIGFLVRARKAGGLRCDAIGVAVRSRTWHIGWSLGKHKSTATENGSIVFFFPLAGLSSLTLFVVFPQRLDGRRLLAHVADHKGHREVVEAMAPRDLHDCIEGDEIVAGIQHANIAFSTTNVDELGSD